MSIAVVCVCRFRRGRHLDRFHSDRNHGCPFHLRCCLPVERCNPRSHHLGMGQQCRRFVFNQHCIHHFIVVNIFDVDFAADISMARQNAPRMGFSACYGAPVLSNGSRSTPTALLLSSSDCIFIQIRCWGLVSPSQSSVASWATAFPSRSTTSIWSWRWP